MDLTFRLGCRSFVVAPAHDGGGHAGRPLAKAVIQVACPDQSGLLAAMADSPVIASV